MTGALGTWWMTEGGEGGGRLLTPSSYWRARERVGAAQVNYCHTF